MEVGGIHVLGIEVVTVILVGPAKDGALKLKVLIVSSLKCTKTGIDLVSPPLIATVDETR